MTLDEILDGRHRGSSDPARTYAVIPAYNPGDALSGVVEQTARVLGADRILVVDDGSTDGAPRRVGEAGFRVIVHPENRGKGAALRTGFAHAMEEQAAGVVTLDADGQHRPEWIERLLAASGEADLVLGSRMHEPGSMPRVRILVNRFTSAVVSALAGARITDSQSGFRWISAQVLRGVSLESQRYDLESEILIKAACSGYRIGEVAIPALYGDEVSKIHPIRDTARFLRLLWRSLRWRREMKRSGKADSTR